MNFKLIESKQKWIRSRKLDFLFNPNAYDFSSLSLWSNIC